MGSIIKNVDSQNNPQYPITIEEAVVCNDNSNNKKITLNKKLENLDKKLSELSKSNEIVYITLEESLEKYLDKPTIMFICLEDGSEVCKFNLNLRIDNKVSGIEVLFSSISYGIGWCIFYIYDISNANDIINTFIELFEKGQITFLGDNNNINNNSIIINSDSNDELNEPFIDLIIKYLDDNVNGVIPDIKFMSSGKTLVKLQIALNSINDTYECIVNGLLQGFIFVFIPKEEIDETTSIGEFLNIAMRQSVSNISNLTDFILDAEVYVNAINNLNIRLESIEKSLNNL